MTEIELSGESFGNRQRIIKKYCKPGMPVRLVREPDNPYDKNAIAVFVDVNGQPESIGYFNKYSAIEYAPRMDQGKTFDATIRAIYGKEKLGVYLDVYQLKKDGTSRRPVEAEPEVQSDSFTLPKLFAKLFGKKDST